LFAGLEFLYRTVKQAETEARQRLMDMDQLPEPGRAPAPSSVPAAVRVCAFHWYATTACNLIKMIGWIRRQENPQGATPAEYAEKVLSAVRLWRDKVAAYFAVHTPYSKDTPADELPA